MVNDVRNVLAAANRALTEECNHYNTFYEDIDNIFDKRDARMILDRRTARLERVQQVQNFRRSLVLDLNDQSQAFLQRQL